MLFPQLGPAYYEEEHTDILGRMEASYAETITINQSFWGEADTDTRFEAGDQTLWNDLYGANLPANRRRQFTFNRIRPIINMITGYQRRNRKSTVCIPIENADAQTADQFTKILMHIDKTSGVLDTISTAFHGSLVTGMNLLQLWVDYRQDPINGEIKVDNCPYNSFLIDPYFRKPDLSDCNFIWKRSFLTKRECVSLMPDKKDLLMGLMGVDNRDGKFQYMAEAYNYGLKNLLTYDEYYYRDFRKQKLLVDIETGDTMEWRGNDPESLRMFLDSYPQIDIITQEIPTVRLAIVVQGRVVFDGPNPIGIDEYPFVPVWAYYNPQMPYFPYRIQGVVRSLRDAQFLYNRRQIINLDILESQINSGYKYKEDALVNPADVFLSGQGKGLALKTTAQMSDVEQILPPALPASDLQLVEKLAQELLDISNVNQELMGSAIDDKAGILSMLRQGAGLTGLQILFDHLDQAQKMLGRRMIDLIQVNYTPGKIQKIVKEQPAPLFYNKAFGKYDCVVEEGLNTATQKQMQFAQLLQLRELGIYVSDERLIDSAVIQGKQEFIDDAKQHAQQQAQVQQMQMQVQMQEQQARINLAQSRAVADQGLGVERLSRVQENQALAEERKAQAQKDEEQALLTLVKALKELEGVDLDNLAKLLALRNTVSAVEKNDRQNESPSPIANMPQGMPNNELQV